MSSLPRILTIMGSGETAPTMVKTHREIFSSLPGGSHAVVLDTPYGFQENASELAQRAIEYFRVSINAELRVAGLARIDSIDPLELERALLTIDDANYVFAGPGSPTYALRQWSGSGVTERILTKMHGGGAVTFASAAALTLGRFTVPVYEIYKAGHDPYWLDGLDVMSAVGLPVVVVPHYDNAEGGHHDTRFCYLGEKRLSQMEAELPSDVFVLGIDEHTGLVLDLDNDSATVTGKGMVTVRRRDKNTVFQSGETVSIDRLRFPDNSASNFLIPSSVAESTQLPIEPTSLGASIDESEHEFKNAILNRDSTGATRAILKLESAIRLWSADTLQSDEMDRAHSALRSMISRLGEFARDGIRDPREVLMPLMNIVLTLRTKIRSEKQFALADLLRDELTALGIEVRDTSDGPQWLLQEK